MRIKRGVKTGLLFSLLFILAPALSGCWYLVAGGAGAYGGYKMKEKGYTVQNPITKEKSSSQKAQGAQ